MKNKRKGILLALICLTSILMASLTAFAAGPLDGQVVDGSLLTSDSKSEDTRELVPVEGYEGGMQPYGTYLSYGTSAIADNGGGQINFSGSTVCYRNSDYVEVILYLQKLINGSWVNYAVRYQTEYNTSAALAGYNMTVTTGAYYRVKGVHTAKKGSVVESTTSYTSGVYIG